MGVLERMERVRGVGRVAGLIWGAIFVVGVMWWGVLEWVLPREKVERVEWDGGWDGEGDVGMMMVMPDV